MKSLLGLKTLSRDVIESILIDANKIKSQPDLTNSLLKGKTTALLFFENSTRTRTSFEVAIKQLGGTIMSIPIANSSLKKGETVKDTMQNIEALGVDAFIIRHADSGAASTFSTYTNKPIINAGDGSNEHPTQALTDIFTLEQEMGQLKGKNILIVGDILHSRVARSNIWGLKKMGANVLICAPQTLLPVGIEQFGVKVCHNLTEAIKEADAVMVLRIQLERESGGYLPSLSEYRTFFGVTLEKLKEKKVFLLHPGPINRWLEVDTDAMDSNLDKTLVLKQVQNSVVVRKAVLKYCFT